MSASERDESTRGCCSFDPELAKYRVEWAMWGNMNILYAAVLIFVGGVVAATVDTINFDSPSPHSWGTVTRWITIPIGIGIFFFEYPRSARKNKKKNVERPGQKYLAPLVHHLRFLGRNYIVRFIVYQILIIPCLFTLSTILGAICLSIGIVCYFLAGLYGEEWKAPSLGWGPGAEKEEEEEVGHTLPEAPSHPPPRLPPQLQYIPEAPSRPPPRPTVK